MSIHKKLLAVATIGLSVSLCAGALVPAASAFAADSTPSGELVAAAGVKTVRTNSGNGTAVLSLTGTTMQPTGRSLANGTQWQIFGTMTLNGTGYTNVGGNQWVASADLADPAQGPVVTPDSFIGRIHFVPGYGVRLFAAQNGGVTPTGRYLQHGTAWKVTGHATINGIVYDNLGGNQWVEAQYIEKVGSSTPSGNTVTPLASGSWAVVSYAKGAGIAVWQRSANGSFSLAKHSPLSNGSRWTVYQKATANGKTYYNLGGNQWVQGDYVIVGRATGDALTLDVPYISQYNPVFAPWGCASTALSMLMAYDGVKVDKAFLQYAQEHLPMYPANPDGQKGDPFTGKGFGWVIGPNALTTYAHNWDKRVVNISGASTETIKNLVLTGHPVVYYGWSSYQNLKADKNRNHDKVILGYKNGLFLVHDPLYSNSSKTAGQGGTKELGYNNGYDQGAIYWSTMSKFNAEYNGQALSTNR